MTAMTLGTANTVRWIRRFLTVVTAVTAVIVSTAAAQDPKTIKPGMTEAEVRTAWGEPLTVRKAGEMTYLYYRNDCLRRCGTYDIVFLEGGQVVDAIVRAKDHRYDGISSSPAERKAVPSGP
jgi:hypothetical protein